MNTLTERMQITRDGEMTRTCDYCKTEDKFALMFHEVSVRLRYPWITEFNRPTLPNTFAPFGMGALGAANAHLGGRLP